MPETPLLLQLQTQSSKFSKSDIKIIDVINADPNAVIHSSIAILAQRAEVSEPTVNRFCHKLGCNGYPDFKLGLAQELSSSRRLFMEGIEEHEESSVLIQKVCQSIHSSLDMLVAGLAPKRLDEAAQVISQCASVYFFGTGASSSVALDAQHKFFRFGFPAIAHTDFINQRIVAATLKEKDVAVFISYTGRTQSIIDNARYAHTGGATTIGITHQHAPLAAHCDIVLNAQTAEDTDLFTPMSSRIAHLAVIDMLATKVALSMGAEVEQNIKNIKLNLANTRVEPA